MQKQYWISLREKSTVNDVRKGLVEENEAEDGKYYNY